MKEIKKIFSSIRAKLFISLCIVVLFIISFLIVLNNFVLEKFYLYNKQVNLKLVYNIINKYYNDEYSEESIENEMEKISIKNNFEIQIRNRQGESIYVSNKDFFSAFFQIMSSYRSPKDRSNILSSQDNYKILETNDQVTNIKYIVLSGILDNGYSLYIRMPISSIQESVKISNKFLYIIAMFVIILGGFVISIISRRFSQPIEELEQIATKMSNLDFSQKYKVSKSNDEIDKLGKSINTLSNKLESTIKQLKTTNFELEKDVEEKSQIDEMRKSFISDVSHELKTPIALIQGYSEGLIENVNSDKESRDFYAEVILDEATKMDTLVKRLLELMKLEYGNMNFDNKEFDIVKLEQEILRKSGVMIEKEEINQVEFEEKEKIAVFADDFYIEQVITNYLTNAIKYASKINGVKKIKITNKIDNQNKKVRITIFNTLEGLSEEDLVRIWNRFYKIDESRNRSKGGSGIGLSIVKAIMNNYGNEYGARNVVGGIEFYFDVDLK